MPTTLEPFRLQVEQTVLDDLALRLEQGRRLAVGEKLGWELGTDPAYLAEVLATWRTTFDWRKQEAWLNRLPQFQTRVDGTALHFIHARASGPGPAMPLLLLHGWPDSFLRYHKVLGHFTSDGAFDVVVPSLPGFPLSEALAPGTEQPLRRTGALLWKLMTEGLGYRRFGIVGGDTGSAIAQAMAIDHPESVVGLHLTDLGWHALGIDQASATAEERHYVEQALKALPGQSAYALVQMTRPRSLSPALNDSPVGLASWVLDRFHAWTDAADGLEAHISRDELLTNLMLYWVTQRIASSTYAYFAEAKSPSLSASSHVDRPVAVALFPKDLAGSPPRSLGERTLNVQRWTELPRGGHFAAWEEPELFATDVIEFFHPLQKTEA